MGLERVFFVGIFDGVFFFVCVCVSFERVVCGFLNQNTWLHKMPATCLISLLFIYCGIHFLTLDKA